MSGWFLYYIIERFSPMSEFFSPIVLLPFNYHSISVVLLFYYDAYMMRICFSYVGGLSDVFLECFPDSGFYFECFLLGGAVALGFVEVGVA